MVNIVQSDYPPAVAIDKFIGGTTRHTRRIEIYEQDGTTRWTKDTVQRLKDGSVSIDASRDERRTLDLTLDNSDGVLLNAPGEFWYDKIIKVFRGVYVEEASRAPRILIVSDKTAGSSMAASMRSVLVNAGYGDVAVNTLVSTATEMSQYDIVIALSNATGGQLTALTTAYRSGQKLLLFDTDGASWVASTLTGESASGVVPDTVTAFPNESHPVAQGWAPFTLPAIGSATVYNYAGVTGDTVTPIAPIATGRALTITASTNLLTRSNGLAHGLLAGDAVTFTGITGAAPLVAGTTYYVIASGLTSTVFKVSATSGGAEVDVTTDGTATLVKTPELTRIAAIQDPAAGGRAVVLSALIDNTIFSDAGFAGFVASAISWLNPVVPIDQWETQVGEFMIDRIGEPNFPHEIKITGRDYTKKCMNSKYPYTTQYIAGYSLEALIASIASNAGIVRKVLPVTGVTVGKTFTYERGASRWDAMKEIANAYNYDIYFTAAGELTMTKFVDPTTTAPALYIETGEEGQMVSYEKATSDTRLYNYIVVTGESSDSTVANYYAISQNVDPASPTSIQEIGERVYTYTSPFFTSTQQCQDYADKLLAIHALEEYELNFESLVLPWLEAGTILGFVDPSPAPGDPTTFLLSSLTIPLGLSPMSGSARRITIV